MPDLPAPPARVAVIVNPVSGVGGPLALHGSDDDLAATALARGARPLAAQRMRRALARLSADYDGRLEVLAAPGSLGEEASIAAGIIPAGLLPRAGGGAVTTAEDTRVAATHTRVTEIDLVLFAGGDGTAADVAAAVAPDQALLGVPTGVKMHSGVFAIDPDRAGAIAAAFLRDTARATREAEVVDDEGTGPHALARARVPRLPGVQHPKAAIPDGAGDMAALGAEIAREIDSERLYLIGPGTSTAAILRTLGFEGTLNGIDALLGGRLILADATEPELRDLVATHPGTRLILGVVGGQGFLLGRGNQQLSAAVLAQIDPADVTIIASHDKIGALHPPVLHVDLDSPEFPTALEGYRAVRTAPHRSLVMRVGDGPAQNR